RGRPMSSQDGCGGPHERAFRQLQKALAACRKHKAKLVIAKLDRLSRNLAFIATLMDSNVEFIAADNPHANQHTTAEAFSAVGLFNSHSRSVRDQHRGARATQGKPGRRDEG